MNKVLNNILISTATPLLALSVKKRHYTGNANQLKIVFTLSNTKYNLHLRIYGAFTLPENEIESETDTDNKYKEPNGSLYCHLLCAV